MPYFDRFDICEAYSALLHDWNVSGRLCERERVKVRTPWTCLTKDIPCEWCEACDGREHQKPGTSVVLHRIGYKPGARGHGDGTFSTENAEAIYWAFLERHRMCSGCDGACWESGASCDQRGGECHCEAYDVGAGEVPCPSCVARGEEA